MAITGLEAAGTRGNCAKLGIDTTMNQSCMALFLQRTDSSFCFMVSGWKNMDFNTHKEQSNKAIMLNC